MTSMQNPTNSQINQNDTNSTIDLFSFLNALWRKMWLLVIVAVMAGSMAYLYTFYMITPTYCSSAMLFVNGSSLNIGSSTISLSDMNTAQNLVARYIVILKTRGTLEAVIERAELPYSYGQLKNMISASSVNNTEIFEVTVTSTNPEEAMIIANTIAEVLPERIKSLMQVSAVEVVDYAVTPQSMVAPNYTKNALTGALAGVVIVAALIFLFEMMDSKLHSEDYLISQYPDIPLLTVIPSLGDSGGKNKYYSSYYKKQHSEK